VYLFIYFLFLSYVASVQVHQQLVELKAGLKLSQANRKRKLTKASEEKAQATGGSLRFVRLLHQV
jgi:hypothetical protein